MNLPTMIQNFDKLRHLWTCRRDKPHHFMTIGLLQWCEKVVWSFSHRSRKTTMKKAYGDAIPSIDVIFVYFRIVVNMFKQLNAHYIQMCISQGTNPCGLHTHFPWHFIFQYLSTKETKHLRNISKHWSPSIAKQTTLASNVNTR